MGGWRAARGDRADRCHAGIIIAGGVRQAVFSNLTFPNRWGLLQVAGMGFANDLLSLRVG